MRSDRVRVRVMGMCSDRVRVRVGVMIVISDGVRHMG